MNFMLEKIWTNLEVEMEGSDHLGAASENLNGRIQVLSGS